jgi:hypothetical protein
MDEETASLLAEVSGRVAFRQTPGGAAYESMTVVPPLWLSRNVDSALPGSKNQFGASISSELRLHFQTVLGHP